jgi:hypothetical protein
VKQTSIASALVLLAASSASAQIGFGTPTVLAAATNPSGTAAIDFNRDGLVDLAVTVDGPDRVLLFRNTGAGFATAGTIFLGNGVGAETLVSADFDLDGWADLAIAEHNLSRIQILRNVAGTLTLGTTIAAGAESRAIRTADLNGDGRTDLLTANREGNSVTVAMNLAAGWSATAVAVGTEPRAVAPIDADNDGDADLIVTNHRDRNASLLRNNGSGVFTLASTINTGPAMRPDGVDAADLNGDGRADFVVTQDNNNIGYASVFINTGAGFVGPVHYVTGGANPGELLLRDFDRDGDIDAAIANQDSATIAIMTGNNTGALTLALSLASGANPHGPTAADFNGDRKLDLAIVAADAGTASIFSNTTPGALCAADFNADGFVDFFDWSDFVAAFDIGNAGADFNADGFIDFFDFNDYAAAFEAGC